MSRRIQSAPPASASSRVLRRIDSDSARDARNRVLEELEAWRESAVPERSTPLDAEDLVRLLRDCVGSLGLSQAIAADVGVNTIHYYRRKDIIDPPAGRTAAARYDIHHLWQVAGARLAGFLSLATLAEARDAIRGTDEAAAMYFLAARIVDARARESARDALIKTRGVAASVPGIRPLPGVIHESAAIAARIISLPDGAWCVIPATHAALHSAAAAKVLTDGLAKALRSIQTS